MDRAVQPVRAPIRGLPWPVAVLLSLAAATAGSLFDLRVSHSLGVPFASAYILGALGAVTVTRRSGITIPMLTPPLIMLAATAIGVYTDIGAHGSVGMVVFTIAAPVLPQFPVMAATTAATLVIGTIRLLRPPRQRRGAFPGQA